MQISHSYLGFYCLKVWVCLTQGLGHSDSLHPPPTTTFSNSAVPPPTNKWNSGHIVKKPVNQWIYEWGELHRAEEVLAKVKHNRKGRMPLLPHFSDCGSYAGGGHWCLQVGESVSTWRGHIQSAATCFRFFQGSDSCRVLHSAPGSVVGAKDTVVSKADKPLSMGSLCAQGETVRK